MSKQFLILDKRQRRKALATPYAVKRLIEEISKDTEATITVAHYDQLLFEYKGGKENISLITDKGIVNILDFTHIIFRGHRLEFPRHYEFKSIIIEHIQKYNPSTKILNANAILTLRYYDKLGFAHFCQQHNIPIFHTLFTEKKGFYQEQSSLDFPYIAKEVSGINDYRPINGTYKIKKNVYKLERENDWDQEFLNTKDPRNFFIQEYADTGEDIRVFVSHERIIGGFKRQATADWKTVSHGRYLTYNEPAPEIASIATKLSTALQADFLAVDIMYKDSSPYVLEFSLHPGFKAYETKTSGDKPVNIAKEIVGATECET